jgi:hypothetical protein
MAGELRSQPPYIQLYICGLKPYISWYNQDNQSHFNKLFNNLFLNLTNLLNTFISSYFNNNVPSPLSKILNNRFYYFKINKETSTLTFISISTTKKGLFIKRLL